MLLPPIASVLRLQEMIYKSAKEFSDPQTVVLKIGMSQLVSTKFITPLIHSFKAQNHGHEILLIEENLSVLDEKLARQELDLILVPAVRKAAGKNVLHLYDEGLFFVIPLGDPGLSEGGHFGQT